jgi:anti-sigma factor RsiW
MWWIRRKKQIHTQPELLSEYVDGRLSASRMEAVERHLSACASCQREVESLRATVALLKQVPLMRPHRSYVLLDRPAPVVRSLVPLWAMGAAASLVLLIFVSILAADLGGALSTERFAPAPAPLDTTGEEVANFRGMAAETPESQPPALTDAGMAKSGIATPSPVPAMAAAGPESSAEGPKTAPPVTTPSPEAALAASQPLQTSTELTETVTPAAWRYVEGALAGLLFVLVAASVWFLLSRRAARAGHS